MSNPTFIRIGPDRLVNMAHVISAEFWPADPGGDNDGEGNAYGPTSARLAIVTTELVAREFGYDGNYDAAASESVTVTVRGAWAEAAWSVFVAASAPGVVPMVEVAS